MTIGIDFDGTIVEKADFPSTEMKPIPNAIPCIKKLGQMGHKLVLCSARYGWFREIAAQFIHQQGLPVEVSKTRLKPNCDIYIDDRNIFCDGINWKKIVNEIKRITKCTM